VEIVFAKNLFTYLFMFSYYIILIPFKPCLVLIYIFENKFLIIFET